MQDSANLSHLELQRAGAKRRLGWAEEHPPPPRATAGHLPRGEGKCAFSFFLSFLPCCCCPDTLPGCLPGVLWFLRTLEGNRRGQGQREQGPSCQSPDVPGKVAFQSPACSGPGAGIPQPR